MRSSLFRDHSQLTAFLADTPTGGGGEPDGEENLPTEKEPTPEEEKPAEEPGTDKDTSQGADYWRSRSRENESKARDNYAKLEKINEKLAGTETALEQEKTKNIRLQVALNKGVPADLITGSTLEECEAQAQRLLEYKGANGVSKDLEQVGNASQKTISQAFADAVGES